MIFYGKAGRRVAAAAALLDVEARVAEALAPGLPIERHAAWVAALVEAGGLAQGLADAEAASAPSRPAGESGTHPGQPGWDPGPSAEPRGMRGASVALDDDPLAPESAEIAPSSVVASRRHLLPRGEKEAAAMALCLALAAVMGRSWDSAFSDLPAALPAPVADALARLRALPLPEAVEVRRAEGFAHYAVYPEAHWAAAAGLAAPRPGRVLGLRSIGTALSAAAAAALGAPAPRTARPHGHPFARRVDLAPLDAAERGAAWAVVDEGPGLSGSSMGAAADALVRAGVPAERIALLPGHAGPPGPMASDAHRRLWAEARVATVPFEALALDPGRGLAAWVADITGPLRAPPEDLAGGVWRRHRFADEAAWPAVDRQNERRAYLLRGARAAVVMRFAGLGALGREKLARARALHAGGFGIAPLALRHGFLVEPWRGDLRPLRRPPPLPRLAGYLAFRASSFPAAEGDGAPLDALLAMARANAIEALGEGAAAGADRWAARLPALARRARPVAVDGRLAAHAWLASGAGPGDALKDDALDGCCGHDLVGCQDIAWDVAGAAVEHGLGDAEVEALRGAVERGSGAPCDPGLVGFFRLAYPAFRIGALTLARGREDGAEADRLALALRLQISALRTALA